MPEKIIKQHVIALAKLLKLYKTAPLDKNLLQASLVFCKSLYATAKAHPDLIFAQPQLYKSQLPFIVNLTFNSTVLTCLLAVRNKFDPAVTIQLMCGSLSIYALQQSTIAKHYQTDKNSEKLDTKSVGQTNAKFVQLLKNNQQHVWLSNYVLCAHIHLTHYPRATLTNSISALAYLANKLALLCIPNKHKQPISFAHAFKHLSLKCCSRWYELLCPLLQYPSLSPPGSYVRMSDNVIHIVLSVNPNGLVTKPLLTKQTGAKPSMTADFQLTPLSKVKQSFPSQKVKFLNKMSQWWGSDLQDWLSSNSELRQIENFAPLLPIQRAPASLLIIQDQLKHVDTDISVIVKAIEKEPAYAHQLQISASIRNRQKKPVKNIQHSLAMLGFERTRSILLQHSLLFRSNQQYFPLQQALLNFSQFFVFVAGDLAAKTKLVSPEQAATTAYFLVSRLFTLPTIRCLTHWETSSLASFKVASLINVKANKNLKNDALLLASAWQQNKQILEILQQYDLVMLKQELQGSISQFCYLLGISLTLAKEYYFSIPKRCKETISYVNSGLTELDISQTELVNMMNDIVTNTHVYCQLE